MDSIYTMLRRDTKSSSINVQMRNNTNDGHKH